MSFGSHERGGIGGGQARYLRADVIDPTHLFACQVYNFEAKRG